MKKIGITVYGCERDEGEAFRRLSPGFGVMPATVSDAVSETNAGLAFGNQCVSVGHKSEVTGPIILALRDAGVRYISTRSVGCNHIDEAAAKRLGIAVAGVAYSPDSVADYTLMLMLMAVRNAKSIVRAVEKYDFRLGQVRGQALRDMTIGVLGTGRIGGAVARRLRGFGCRTLACDHRGEPKPELELEPKPEQSAGCGADGVDYVSLGELLGNSDIVTLHVPLGADTRHIIGGAQMREMKQGAFLINTGRGALVDTEALTTALEDGKLGGAALDVLEGEEGLFYFDHAGKPIDNQLLLRLQAMPNVIITPHTAYYTKQALRDTALKTIRNCLEFERGAARG